MLALFIGAPCWFTAAARAGLLWEELGPEILVYFSENIALLFVRHQFFCVFGHVGSRDTDLRELMVTHA